MSETKKTSPANYLSPICTIAKLELTGKARSKKWITAMIAWIAVLVVMWIGLESLTGWIFGSPTPYDSDIQIRQSTTVYSFLLFFVLTISLIVAPSLSATSINGDRDTANLAILQATPVTAGQLMWGKLLSAWIGGALFVLVAGIPLSIFTILNGIEILTLIKALGFLLLEVFLVCSLGLGFSAVITRPVMSVLTTFLLIIGISGIAPLAFLFTQPAVTEAKTLEYMSLVYTQDYEKRVKSATTESEYEPQANELLCQKEKRTITATHSEKTWLLLGLSPFAMMPDAVAGSQTRKKFLDTSTRYDTPLNHMSIDLAILRNGEKPVSQKIQKATQVKPPRISVEDECLINKNGTVVELQENKDNDYLYSPDSDSLEYRHLLGHSWYWGIGIHTLLAAGALLSAWTRLRTPIKHLSPGVRIA